MNLAVSNIAWNAAEDDDAFKLLTELEIRGLEIAPSRIWPDPSSVSTEEACLYLKETAAQGLRLLAFQALLFGKEELTLFKGDSFQPCLDYLMKIGQLAAQLGAGVLVFGSPRNRSIPEGLPAKEAHARAIDFFSELGECYTEMGIVLGLEPNPAAYGGNFIQTTDEAATLIRAVASPGFRLHLDAGALQMNGEAIETVVEDHADLIAHVHASEPMLVPLSSAWHGHRRLALALQKIGYKGTVSLEMKRPEEGMPQVKEAVQLLKELYS